MRWTTRARILRTIAALPAADHVYQLLQRRFGAHHRHDFIQRRLRSFDLLASLARDHATPIHNAHIVEIGTGWIPLIPTLAWLAGAARTDSFDIRPLYLPSLTARAFRALAHHRDTHRPTLEPHADDPARLDERFDTLARLADRPDQLLAEANIHLHAPADARDTRLPDARADLVISSNVLEHVEPALFPALLAESARILRPAALAIHHVDLSDHFAHADPSITTANFLAYDDDAWHRIAAPRFAYHNRLRAPEIERLIADSPLQLIDTRRTTDPRALDALRAADITPAPRFAHLPPEDLAVSTLDLVARAPL